MRGSADPDRACAGAAVVTGPPVAGAGAAQARKGPARKPSTQPGSSRQRETCCRAEGCRPVPAEAPEVRRPSRHWTTPTRLVVWWRASSQADRASEATGREAAPGGPRPQTTPRRCGCPERRELRCSERLRRWSSGHRRHLGAEVDRVERGRPTARSRTSPSRQVPPTRKSTGASKPSRAVWVFAACSPSRQPQVLAPNIDRHRLGGRPSSEGAGPRRTAKGRRQNPLPGCPRRAFEGSIAIPNRKKGEFR